MLREWFERNWWISSPTVAARALSPLSTVYGAAVTARRAAYSHGVFRPYHPGVPVVVVGNLVVGGAGKTPITQAIVRCLQQAGYRPGVVSRGYPVSPKKPIVLNRLSRAAEVGDEPLLHAALGIPVVVCRSRVEAVQHLLTAHSEVDVIVADDALQHYALARDIEVEVLSAERQYGNGLLLPAGPLREPLARAKGCQLRLMPTWNVPSGEYKTGGHHWVRRRLGLPYALVERERTTPFTTFGNSRPAIVAAIANPRQFFDALRRAGIEGELFAFPDHYEFKKEDFAKLGDRPILMTEKDAVKCASFADLRMWAVPMTVHLAPQSKRKLLHYVKKFSNGYAPELDESLNGPQTA